MNCDSDSMMQSKNGGLRRWSAESRVIEITISNHVVGVHGGTAVHQEQVILSTKRLRMEDEMSRVGSSLSSPESFYRYYTQRYKSKV